MAVDFKSELTRPLALILFALAALGWVLFVLSSWSSASAQKTQRVKILQLSEKSERLGADLNRMMEASASLADLQTKVASAREDLTRVTQTRNDMQAELSVAQKTLTAARRDLSEADRTLQNQSQKLTELQATGEDVAIAPAIVPRQGRSRRSFRTRRASRSFNVRSR